MNPEELILNGAAVVDVRTREEFRSANVPNSINIPLNEVQSRLGELREMQGPLVLCCLSGGRSGQATAFLQQQGIECVNAGSWMDVNYVLGKAV